jgi:hypothetical protein
MEVMGPLVDTTLLMAIPPHGAFVATVARCPNLRRENVVEGSQIYVYR